VKKPEKVIDEITGNRKRTLTGIRWDSLAHTESGETLHFVRLDHLGLVERVGLPQYSRWRLAGLDIDAPEEVIPHLSDKARRSALKLPPIDTAMRISDGARLTIEDCEEIGVEFPKRWTGKARVEIEAMMSGVLSFALMLGDSTRGSVWSMDTTSRAHSVGLAALVNASAEGLKQELLAEQDAQSRAA